MSLSSRLQKKGLVKSPFSVRPKLEVNPDAMWKMLEEIATKVINERMRIFEARLEAKTKSVEDAAQELLSTVPVVQAKADTTIANHIRSRAVEIRGENGKTPIAGVDFPIPKNGEDGTDGKTPTSEELVSIIKPLIPEPIKGEDAVPPTEEELLSLVKPIVQKALKEFGAQMSVKRGGGDVVVAGANITITHENGKKTIASTGGSGSLSVLAATGTVDDSNVTFTFASTPTLVVVNGATYRDGHGCTIVATTVTLDNPVGTGGDIYALG